MRFSLIILTLIAAANFNASAQKDQQLTRIANIRIDPSKIDQYYAALKEQMNAAIQNEPGVLSYYAMADKNDSSRITILEVYASEEAYKKHITTSHFKKYKDTVKDMVKSLELIDVNLIAATQKKKE